MFTEHYLDRQMWCIYLLSNVVDKFVCKYRVWVCNLVVVRHFIYFECFSGVRAVLSSFANSLYLLSTIQTDRCGAFICLTMLLTNLHANIVFARATLLWCGTLYILNVLVVLEQFCRLSPIVYIY